MARISRIQERVVDLSKPLHHRATTIGNGTVEAAQSSNAGPSNADPLIDDENDNPFDLSDGLRWYLIDAVEDKSGAPPATPAPAKTTVAANNVEVMGDMHSHGRVKGPLGRGGVPSGIEGVSKTLSKSLESRRSSTGSRKTLPFTIGNVRGKDGGFASETNSLRAVASDTPSGTSPVQQYSTPPQIQGQITDSTLDQPTQRPAQPTTEVRTDN